MSLVKELVTGLSGDEIVLALKEQSFKGEAVFCNGLRALGCQKNVVLFRGKLGPSKGRNITKTNAKMRLF